MHRTVLLAAAALGAGCSTYYNHVFHPAPLEVRQEVPGDPDSQARALVTVVGIRKPDADAGAPARFEVRMRVENLGANPAVLVADSLSLVAADLRALGPATVSPEPAPIAQGEVVVYEVGFPFPGGATPRDYDLKGINLGWALDFGEKTVQTGVTFDRHDYAPVEPRVSFGFGYYRSG